MNIAQLLTGTLKVVPLTSERWQTRVVRIEGKQVNKQFNTATYKALVYGGTVGTGVYLMYIMFSEPGLGNLGKPTKSANIRVKCSCRAHRFFFANANLQAGAFWGKPDKWAKVPSKRNNVRRIPGMCKHLVAFIYLLMQIGEIDVSRHEVF